MAVALRSARRRTLDINLHMAPCAIREGIEMSVGRVFADAIKLLNPGRELFALAGNPVDAIAARRTAFSFDFFSGKVHWIHMCSGSFHHRSGLFGRNSLLAAEPTRRSVVALRGTFRAVAHI